MFLDNPESNTGFSLNLSLKIFGKLLITLGCNNGQRIDFKSTQSQAMLIDAQPQTTPYRLAAFTL